MTEALADTGPILHLHEIGHLQALQTFETIVITPLVRLELQSRGIGTAALTALVGLRLDSMPPARAESSEVKLAHLQAADVEVLNRARVSGWSGLVLTDDLALRRVLEEMGLRVSGSFGILLRSYTKGALSRRDLDLAVEALFTASTLHTGQAFRLQARKILRELT